MTSRPRSRLSDAELDAAFTAADPLVGLDTAAVNRAHLRSVGAVLAHLLTAATSPPLLPPSSPPPARRRRWRRGVLAGVAAAVVLPAAAVVLGPPVAAHLGDRSPNLPFVAVAIASPTKLTCADAGAARRIAPVTAPTRLWPASVPAGWRIHDVFALRPRSTASWCTRASLVAVRTDPTGLITATVELTGPVPGIAVDPHAATTPDRVAGYPAIRFTGTDPTARHTWVVTDPTGAQWFAAVDGYPLDRARALLGAAGLDGHTVTWDTTRAPGLRVVSRRTGPPYPVTVHTGVDWYLDLTSPRDTRSIIVWSQPGGAPAGTQAAIGARLLSVHGIPMMVDFVRGQPVDVYATLGADTVAWADVHGDLPQAEAMLLSLHDLPADDPRLRRYALNFDTEDDQPAVP